MEQDVITMQDIFLFERTGMNPEGKVRRPVPRHRRPAEVRREARDDGHSLPIDMFEHVQQVA